MNRFKIIDGPVQFGSGETLELTHAQVEPRAHNLDIVSTDEKSGRAVVTVRSNIEFKAGEVVGLAALPRWLEQKLEAVDAPKSGSVASKGAVKPANRKAETGPKHKGETKSGEPKSGETDGAAAGTGGTEGDDKDSQTT